MPRAQTSSGALTPATCRRIAESLKSRVAYVDLGAMLRSNGLEINAVAGRTLPSRKYEPRASIAFGEGHELLYIVRGALDVVYPCGTGRIPVTRAGPGILLGEAPWLGISMMSTKALAAAQTLTTLIDLETGAALIAALPEWRRLIGERLIQAEVYALRERFSAVESLLIAALFELAGEEGVVRGVSQQALASRLGVTRGMVLRSLTELKQAGLVEWGWKKLVLLDREGLQKRMLFSSG